MKKILLYTIVLCCVSLVSCNNSPYRGFTKMDNGAYMKFYVTNNENQTPKIGDYVVFDIIQSIGDSVVFNSAKDYQQPMQIEITESEFIGDLISGLLNMHIGDSATITFPVDSMFLSALNQEIPDFLQSGTPIYIDLNLKSIKTKEEISAENVLILKELKHDEDSLAAPYYSDKKNVITDNGLVILNLKKGKGKTANVGDIMKVKFLLRTLSGDTLLNFIGDNEPYELAYGDKALGEGFDESLGMIAKGGEGSFMIPSSLAFDSVGIDNAILPYTAFLLDIQVIDIMSRVAYDAEQLAIKEKEEAENTKRLSEEPEKISQYVKNHDITVNPSLTGVYYIEQSKGLGDLVEDGDTVSIHYNLYNLNEVLVESSYQSGQPLMFVYGQGEMVPGIEEAIGMMKVGGKARIIVPSEMGFGPVAIDENLPANSTLIFDLEFLDLKK